MSEQATLAWSAVWLVDQTETKLQNSKNSLLQSEVTSILAALVDDAVSLVCLSQERLTDRS